MFPARTIRRDTTLMPYSRYSLLVLGLSSACLGTHTTARSSDMPATLDSHDIRDGLATVQADAKACGVEHGAEPGTAVRVKLVIAGPTGQVKSAEALSPWTASPLGSCVADVVSEAQFRPCEKESVGVVFPILL